MESAEAILENENNSNVESESHIRQQQSNQNAGAHEEGGGTDASEINLGPDLNDASVDLSKAALGDSHEDLKVTSQDSSAEMEQDTIDEEVGAEEGLQNKSKDLVDSGRNDDDRSSSLEADDINELTNEKAIGTNASTSTPQAEQENISENEEAKESFKNKDDGDSDELIGSNAISSAKQDLGDQKENAFDTVECLGGDGDDQCDLSEPPTLTKQSETETESFLHFSPLGDNDLVPNLVRNISENENSQIISNNDDDTAMEVEKVSNARSEGAEESSTGNSENTMDKEMEMDLNVEEPGTKAESSAVSQEEENMLLDEEISDKDNKVGTENKAESEQESMETVEESSENCNDAVQKESEQPSMETEEETSENSVEVQKESEQTLIEAVEKSSDTNDVGQIEPDQTSMETAEESEDKDAGQDKSDEQPSLESVAESSEKNDGGRKESEQPSVEIAEGSSENDDIEEKGSEQPTLETVGESSEKFDGGHRESEKPLMETVDGSPENGDRELKESEQPALESVEGASENDDKEKKESEQPSMETETVDWSSENDDSEQKESEPPALEPVEESSENDDKESEKPSMEAETVEGSFENDDKERKESEKPSMETETVDGSSENDDSEQKESEPPTLEPVEESSEKSSVETETVERSSENDDKEKKESEKPSMERVEGSSEKHVSGQTEVPESVEMSESSEPEVAKERDNQITPKESEVALLEQDMEMRKEDEKDQVAEKAEEQDHAAKELEVEKLVEDVEHVKTSDSSLRENNPDKVKNQNVSDMMSGAESLEDNLSKEDSSAALDKHGLEVLSNVEGKDSANDHVLSTKDIKKEADVESCAEEKENSQPVSKEVKKEIMNDADQDEADIVILDDSDDSASVSVKKEGHDGKGTAENGMGIQISAVSGGQIDASGLAKDLSEDLEKVEKASSKSKTQKCIVCQKVTKCKFNIVRGGDTKQLCDDVCFKKFRKSPASFLTKPAAVPQTKYPAIQPKPSSVVVMAEGGSTPTASEGAIVTSLKSGPAPSVGIPKIPSGGANEQYKSCTVCQVMNLQSPQTFCNWKGFDFCGEHCLGKFQFSLKASCSNCFTFIPTEMRSSLCTKIGNVMYPFCKQNCVQEFMKKLKTCACCKQDLSSFTPVIATVGADDRPKEFCSQDCVKKLEDQVNDVEIVHVEPGKGSADTCSVCKSQDNAAKHTVRFHSKTFKLCSDLCLSAFQYTNNINLNKCSSCGSMCTAMESQAHFIQFEGETKRFCSDRCIGTFRLANRKLTGCTWCAARKVNFDMIERQDENNKYQLFCSLNCLSLFRVNLQAKSNQAVDCDKCKKFVPAQYHLTMSDASVRNFCSYACVMAFQSQFTSRITPPLPPLGPASSQKGSQQPVVPKPTATPIVPQPQPAAVPPHPHGTRNRGRKPSKTKATQNVPAVTNSSSSIPVISNVVSLASEDAPSDNLTGQQLQERAVAMLLHNLEKKGALVTGDGRQRIVVESQLPKMMKNKALQCKPMCQTKATACRPHSQNKETQTEEHRGKPVIIPVPVPIYIPMPTVMFNAPTPVPVPFAVPIPVPIFIPTTRKSVNGILKTIKDIQERMPADPLEAEMLMMAEAVASDKKVTGDSDTDSEADAGDNDFDTAGDDEPEAKVGMKEKEVSGGAEDMIQMALRMAEEMSGPVEDLETSVQPVAVNSVSVAQRTLEQQPLTQGSNFVEREDPDYAPVKAGRGRGAKRASRGRPSASSRPKRQRTGRSYAEAEIESLEPPPPVNIEPPPDTNYRLKFTYGVNAWKHWVLIKNVELENASKRNLKIRLFPLDVLKCTMDELHHSLCLFIKEVRKPNGDPYSPDSIYYLCLGIQQYLYENGRIDNIFTDLYFQRFTDSLHETLKSLQPKQNSQGQMLCRIEEEHLWESKQLGAHSPYVLLNTLIYFHTKHFVLKTAADHMSLSFAQILKHWKKGVPVKGGMTSSATPKNASLRFYCLANKKQDNAALRKSKEGGVPVYEVTENFDNPLRCPVKLYEFFLSKCPESIKNRNDIFYPVPERSCVPDSPVWYSTQSIQHHTMDKMLTRILLVREIQEAHLHAQPTYIKM